jgi:hypothetical protein
MVELRFNAIKINGQNISGTLTAESAAEGKKKIQRLAEKKSVEDS